MRTGKVLFEDDFARGAEAGAGRADGHARRARGQARRGRRGRLCEGLCGREAQACRRSRATHRGGTRAYRRRARHAASRPRQRGGAAGGRGGRSRRRGGAQAGARAHRPRTLRRDRRARHRMLPPPDRSAACRHPAQRHPLPHRPRQARRTRPRARLRRPPRRARRVRTSRRATAASNGRTAVSIAIVAPPKRQSPKPSAAMSARG